jgi:hypothetical protein
MTIGDGLSRSEEKQSMRSWYSEARSYYNAVTFTAPRTNTCGLHRLGGRDSPSATAAKERRQNSDQPCDAVSGGRREMEMGRFIASALTVVLMLVTMPAWADDLTGSDRFLCASVQATECVDGGDCGIDLPWNYNIPQFVEVDLGSKRLGTTEASGLNRSTAIDFLRREEGVISLQGAEMGRVYTFVISEPTGRATATIVTEGSAVIIFGACTPFPVVADE